MNVKTMGNAAGINTHINNIRINVAIDGYFEYPHNSCIRQKMDNYYYTGGSSKNDGYFGLEVDNVIYNADPKRNMGYFFQSYF
jgi:hypothetical protein